MHNDHKKRWVFGPIVLAAASQQGRHAAGEYSLSCEYPVVVDGYALAYCVMNAQQIRAARKDPRLVVLDSLHSTASIPDSVADHHAAHGLRRGMLLHDALVVLTALHPNFEPEV